MKIVLVIDSPGSSGELELELTQKQIEFLLKLANRWNEENSYHASPYMKLKEPEQ